MHLWILFSSGLAALTLSELNTIITPVQQLIEEIANSLRMMII